MVSNNDDFIPITIEEYEIAERNGIPADLVYSRVHFGDFTVERAITQKVQKKNMPKRIKSLTKMERLAESNGIPRATFLRRMRTGNYTEQQAATEPLGTRKGRYKKKKYKYRDLAKENNIPYSVFYERIQKSNYDEYRAATEPIGLSRNKK